MRVFASLIATVAAMAPVTFNTGGNVSPACNGMQCGPIECFLPFRWQNAKDSGTCCPVCYSAEVVIPGAVPVLVTGASLHTSVQANGAAGCEGLEPEGQNVFCPALLDCPEENKKYTEGDCCKHCDDIGTEPATL